jgi:hypothetical protein
MRHHHMRTTLRLDDDVLASARVLARRGLRQLLPLRAVQASRRNELLLPLQPEGSPVDLELVTSLRDDLT